MGDQTKKAKIYEAKRSCRIDIQLQKGIMKLARKALTVDFKIWRASRKAQRKGEIFEAKGKTAEAAALATATEKATEEIKAKVDEKFAAKRAKLDEKVAKARGKMDEKIAKIMTVKEETPAPTLVPDPEPAK